MARPIATVAPTAGIVGAISLEARGLASALVTESRQLGAVLGTATLGLVLTSVELAQRGRDFTAIDPHLTTRSREALDGILAGGDAGRAALAGLGVPARTAVRNAAAAAYVSGFRVAILVAAGVAVVAGVGAFLLGRPSRAARRSVAPDPHTAAPWPTVGTSTSPTR